MAPLCAISILVSTLSTARAGAFLGAGSGDSHVEANAVEQALLWELSGANSAEVASISRHISPMLSALPKKANGRLESTTARYVLQRYFQQHYGWSIKGINVMEADVLNGTSQMSKFAVPMYLQQKILESHDGGGWDANDLANWAATLLQLIHGEAVNDLEATYESMQLPTQGAISEPDFDRVVRGVLAVTLIAQNASVNDTDDFNMLQNEARHICGSYDDMVMSLHDLRLTYDHFESQSNPFVKKTGVTFARAVEVIRRASDFFGTSTQTECRDFKETLVKMEVGESGRVPLKSFYADVTLPMHESLDYLRNLGVLEETGLKQPRLIIPNYLVSVSRCMSFSNYYKVCCADECEGLLIDIEQKIDGPHADTDRILEIVSQLSSDTVDAPREIPTDLVVRLNEIAGLHQGKVPLHGRMFRQWMHHVYPRECSFPHVTGTYSPMSQDEWLEVYEDLDDAMVSEQEREELLKTLGNVDTCVEPVPWTVVEELVAKDEFVERTSFWSWIRPIMGLVSLSAVARRLMFSSSLLLPSSKAQDQWV